MHTFILDHFDNRIRLDTIREYYIAPSKDENDMFECYVYAHTQAFTTTYEGYPVDGRITMHAGTEEECQLFIDCLDEMFDFVARPDVPSTERERPERETTSADNSLGELPF